jgi:hypothetical protein
MQCDSSYAFTYGTENCVLCNASNQLILNNICITYVPNCQQYQINSTNPGTLVCAQCNANYAIPYGASNCVLCNASNQTIVNNTCFDGSANS